MIIDIESFESIKPTLTNSYSEIFSNHLSVSSCLGWIKYQVATKTNREAEKDYFNSYYV